MKNAAKFGRRFGMNPAYAEHVTAKRYEDLVVWQLAMELKREVYRLTASGPAARDFKFRNQIRAAVAGIPSHLAEGFRRFYPKDFARFVTYGYSALGETKNWLNDGIDRGYWGERDLAASRLLIRRLDPGLRELLHYLTSATPPPRRRRHKRRRNSERGGAEPA
jgi:four helix bundle protein